MNLPPSKLNLDPLHQTTRNLPDVIYMGLQKTGSTYLRAYFTKHPGIIWTRQAYRLQSAGLVGGYAAAARAEYDAIAATNPNGDEVRQPVWIDMYEGLGMDYALNLSDRWNPATMMSSASLRNLDGITISPRDSIAALRQRVPEARLLLTIRNQPEWIFSNYHHYHLRLPVEKRTFADFLMTVEGKIVLSTGHYDRLVGELHHHFGQDRVCVLTLEEIERDRDNALGRLSNFLGCEYLPFSFNDEDFNRGIDSTLPPQSCTEPAPTMSLFRRLRQSLLKLPSQSVEQQHILTKAELRAAHSGLFEQFYAVSNLRLERLLGRSLAEYGYTT